jgi:uncharacterized membrane protein YphA (DoxX/SURF4 family)
MKIIGKVLFLVLGGLFSLPGHAHVKWFSNYDFQQPPLGLSDLNTPLFWGLFLLSLASLPLMIWIDRLADNSLAYKRMNSFLDQYAANGPLIMRVALGAVLLMSWQGDSIIAPEISIPSPLWGWAQFFLALCLLSRLTTFISGVGIIFFYIWGITQHGIFHMLDYVVYLAVGLYLILSHLKNAKFKNLDLPVLYSGLGFSLCWVAFEKMIYPYWGLSVLAQAPALTMGLPHDFFLLSAAFIEFTLGYLLIICLLHRPLAVVITLVFFITTSFFGKTEIVGHTILHGALLVFIVRGPGYYYQAPIRIHKSFFMKNVFAIVNFIILFALLAIPYEKMAQAAHSKSLRKRVQEAHPRYDLPEGIPSPSLKIKPYQDPKGGWNILLETTHFTFTPGNAGGEDKDGEGHAHLYLNGKKIARLYGQWFHVLVPKGLNTLKVTLNTNTHKDYFADGVQVQDSITIQEEREVTVQHQH